MLKATLLALTTTLALAGCTGERVPENDDRVVSTGAASDPDDPLRSGDCGDAFQAVEDGGDGSQTGALDNTLYVCNSADEWLETAEAHPDVLGEQDPMTVLEERCAAVEETVPLCEDVAGNG